METQSVLTAEGHSKLTAELEHLTNVKRREVAERIKSAIEFGDISENSEYDDAKNEQAFVEGRIQQVNFILASCQLIDPKKIKTDKVCLGCCVEFLDIDDGSASSYHLVGSAEADPDNHKISNESPVGKAIIGRRPGETVEVVVPSGLLRIKVTNITK